VLAGPGALGGAVAVALLGAAVAVALLGAAVAVALLGAAVAVGALPAAGLAPIQPLTALDMARVLASSESRERQPLGTPGHWSLWSIAGTLGVPPEREP
jgi:hypothetical protein